MSSRQWTAEQWAAISERRAELAVSAAAGAGKTSVLIERLTQLALGIDTAGRLQPGLRLGLERILVLTFTRAAAAELRARLTQRLQAELARTELDHASRSALREQLGVIPRAQLTTFDSFCADVVRRFGHLQGLGFSRILEADEAELWQLELANRLLDSALGQASPQLRELALAWGGQDGVGPEDLSRARFSGGLRQLVLRLHAFRESLPEPEGWWESYSLLPPLDPANCDWSHPLLSRWQAQLERQLTELLAADQGTAAELAAAHPGAEFLTIITRRAVLLQRLLHTPGWEQRLAVLKSLKDKHTDLRNNPSLLTAQRRDIPKESPWYGEIEARNKPLTLAVELWTELFSRPWAEVVQAENESQILLRELWELCREFGRHWEQLKRERGAVDFAGLARGALSVLAARTGEGALARDADGRLLPSEAALELRRRFAAVLIDEHQDTNELQGAILDLVTRDAAAGPDGGGRPLFAVGDVKQSIYTFRLATPQLFLAQRRRLAQLQSEGLGRVVALNANFRSRRAVVDAVNGIFDGLFTEDFGGEDYSANRLAYAADYEALCRQAGVEPAEAPDLPARLSLVQLGGAAADEIEDAFEDGAASAEDEESPVELGKLALGYRLAAQRLREIHNGGQLIYDKHAPPEQRLRPVAWRDMVVLLRSASGRVETLLRELEAAGIPAYAAGQSGFYERPEVADVLALLSAIDNPRQDVALAAALRGPALGLSPQQLLQLARVQLPAASCFWERVQGFSAAEHAEAPQQHLAERLRQFCARLTRWRDAARREPLAEMLWRLYAECGLLAAAAAQHGAAGGVQLGRQRVANLYRLHDLARQFGSFERQGLARFLRFILLNRRAAGDLGEAPVLSAAEDVVRVMTVHQAKGQEFPVVLVADVHKQFNLQDLRGDVLWQRESGIGGRYLDWGSLRADTDGAEETAPAEPRRFDTLAYRAAAAALKRERLSEELRILYVALTRARERLELVGVMDKTLQKTTQQRPDSAAKCWLDWIAPRLAPELAAAAAGQAGAVQPGRSWCVELLAPEQLAVAEDDTAAGAPGLAGEAAAATAAAEQLSPAVLAKLQRRLNLDYAYSGSSRLPQKVSVSRLAHRELGAAEADRALELSGELAADAAPQLGSTLSPINPSFMQPEAAPTPAQIGAATHRLLAELDLLSAPGLAVITQRRDELCAAGKLDAAAAALIDCAALERMGAELAAHFSPPPDRSWRELPLALLVPATDPRLAGALALPKSSLCVAETDQVYVQGVADLVLAWDDAAVDPAGSAPRLLVLDYKTDRGATAEVLLERYAAQLIWYCQAFKLMLPGYAVQWALYGLSRAGLVGPFDSD